jgi:hypothetical protein
MPQGPDGGKEFSEGTIWTNGDLAMSDFSGQELGGRLITVANPVRSFSFRGARRDSPLVLSSPWQLYSSCLGAIRLDHKIFQAPFSFYESTIKDFLSDREVVRLRMKEENRDGRKIVVLEFAEEMEDSRREGTFWLLKDACWALSAYAMKSWGIGNEGKSWGVWKGEVQYSKIAGRIPYISSARFWTGHQKIGQAEPSIQGLEEYAVLSLTEEALPKERFTLSAFGLSP